MTSHVETIASQLPNMDANDLSKIRQLTDVLLGKQDEGQAQASDDDERIIFEAVKAELQLAGIRTVLSYGRFSQTRHFKAWKKSIPVVVSFLEDSFKGHAETETERLALCRVFIKAIIRDFKRRNIPVSIGTIATNLHRVQQSFDNAFPNYLQSGLAHLIPKALLRNRVG